MPDRCKCGTDAMGGCRVHNAHAVRALDAENRLLRAAINRAYDAAQEFDGSPDVALVCVVETLEPHVVSLGDDDAGARS